MLSNKYLPVEALVSPHLEPDAMLTDYNCIMKAFGAKLDWAAERLSFKDRNITIPATHMRRPIRSKYCSAIKQDADTEDVPVFVSNKCIIPAAHEALIRVFSTARPQKDTLALIEPKIATADTIKDIPQEIWHSFVVARTVTHWCVKTQSALVQVCSLSDRSITAQSKTVVGTISPVTATSQNVAGSVANSPSESPQARIDLAAALDESFERSTFNHQQQPQLLDLCTKYRSVFSLSPKELGKYGLIEKSLSAWGSPVCIVAKAYGSPRFCVDYSNTIDKFLVRETWYMLDIEYYIDTVGGAKFITVCDLQSAY